ncbi:MAG TPA: tRNA (adenosine(37)-N6)-dimethylallyltransferase MiaA [Flexilinea sp.]|jgi:tRNA dimethylallyltransferase|nr:tRNA (adenosine(37)-N6)-dimethylallyltransferase MiaA [Flexilinea sp.]HOP01369.1 tRNA (adenosine(37)-N6)-dimethylallyltransferase MiaA [Flexilinea sp.]HOR55651.1 tRNA (adenosine(37)-N6)-dimethylallyltransferase MiaA [Flexilinea sp.]HOU19884.1 tRNA (adenosine(37)-N6)-dimethylallyltransferase MiaA [Flexilinea sp.]HPJ65503.1 tRNA (adenosine(37)-N6)-dimethylallyltransferase MiaA [Flexilinea sp.]
MSQHPSKIPVTVIVGPTAVGKTAFAIELAKIANAEIVSADSRYFYRGMDIGTAKPTPEERQSIPHHLIDVADPDETWSLALFQQKAYDAIASIHERGKNVIVVGGTGQYIRALLQGWSPPTMEADLVMRAVLEDWANEIGPMEIHKKLAILDPIAAEKIDYRNVRRTIRALEVIFGSGQRFSEQRKVTESPYSFLILGLNRSRSSLYQRIDQRIDQMIRQGFIEEVAGLLEKGYSPALPSMSAIGYREISAYLNHEISLDEAIRLIKQRTRNFVRRQANWFKTNDPQIHWFNLEG